MRRTGWVLGLVLLLQLVLPGPASAWWEFIEAFSGPGPTPFGGDVQLRLYCYPDSEETTATHSGRDVNAYGGAFISLCLNRRDNHTQVTRIASVDVGLLVSWIPGDDDFARGESVWFTSVTPALMLNVIQNRQWDFVEYGFGVGVYRFMSGGFRPFSGVYLEPVRLDFHLPTNPRYRDDTAWKKVLRRTVVRFSPLLFPGGFDEDAFQPSPARRKPSGTEWVNSVGVYVDLEGWLHLD